MVMKTPPSGLHARPFGATPDSSSTSSYASSSGLHLKICPGMQMTSLAAGGPQFRWRGETWDGVPSHMCSPTANTFCLEKFCSRLCDFLDINNDDGLPDPARLGKTLAELHRRSQSPTGKFGFHCTAFDGNLPLTTTWDGNWTAFFTRLLRDVYELDVKVNGPWQEMDEAMKTTVEKVIPRLLDALVADGRTIKPTLIHGDLWESNIGTDKNMGAIYIYDACAYYAHHEKELGIWREPEEEFDDRNRLYSIETLLIHSAHVSGHPTRIRALEEMDWLIHKYCQDA
ncbi:Fructosamine kinase-domain-containing protein [Staphylotrichum tortipilum]|uniref:protein-ribulosamine 3-kinase n=1 Tax=Staphylotrichum tortipilum TaxID=2831512 RepID=A0AAN6RNG0_9PEZI|nr:Fructosamine kinase-domain-containing protein [Staphylotrichum longicolle]